MAISIVTVSKVARCYISVFPPKRNEDGSMPEFDIPEGAVPEMATVVLILSRLQSYCRTFDTLNVEQADRVALFKENPKRKIKLAWRALNNFVLLSIIGSQTYGS